MACSGTALLFLYGSYKQCHSLVLLATADDDCTLNYAYWVESDRFEFRKFYFMEIC
jgi:hypothetical protein